MRGKMRKRSESDVRCGREGGKRMRSPGSALNPGLNVPREFKEKKKIDCSDRVSF